MSNDSTKEIKESKPKKVEKVECPECGIKITKANISTHRKSKGHIDAVILASATNTVTPPNTPNDSTKKTRLTIDDKLNAIMSDIQEIKDQNDEIIDLLMDIVDPEELNDKDGDTVDEKNNN